MVNKKIKKTNLHFGHVKVKINLFHKVLLKYILVLRKFQLIERHLDEMIMTLKVNERFKSYQKRMISRKYQVIETSFRKSRFFSSYFSKLFERKKK